MRAAPRDFPKEQMEIFAPDDGAFLAPNDEDNVAPKLAYYLKASDRIEQIRYGVSAKKTWELATCMDANPDWLLMKLHLSPAKIRRQAKNGNVLSQPESERVLGLLGLIGEVEDMVETYGNLEGFDCVQWFAEWSKSSVPALGGHMPADYLDTFEGQKILHKLGLVVSGAYV